MVKVNPTVLIVPGLFNSGPTHWQSLWQADHPEYIRVQHENWDRPRCEDWITGLDRHVTELKAPVVLVGHSLACSTIAHWARRFNRKIGGALLVAPSDPEAPGYTFDTEGFSPVPLEPLGFRSIVVTTTDDQYVTVERAQLFADSWGSRLVNIGPGGHINSDSGHGVWPVGVGVR